MKMLLSNQSRRFPGDGKTDLANAHGPFVTHRKGGLRHNGGFTLMELMITVVIIAVLAAIAWPIYSGYVARTRRVAAEGCLSEYANYMERYFTTNLRYDQDSAGTPNTLALASMSCAGNSQTGIYYAYSFPATTLSVSTYTIMAAPKTPQDTNDAKCGNLTIDQKGTRTADGTAPSSCW